MKKELKCFTDGIDTFVAYSKEDADDLREDLTGEKPEEFDGEFTEMDPTEDLTISWEELERPQPETKKVSEWIEENGRGFLCSKEW